MGKFGKILLGATVGIGAVAAAPFTGGGSIFAGVALGESLAGAGVAAAAAGVVGAGMGAAAGELEEDDKIEEIKRAKERAFEDGVREGKYKSSVEIKKYVDFLFATTALSYYTARCDGSISKEEQLEIDYDLDMIKKNCDMPDQIKNKLDEIKNNENLNWDEVIRYCDEVGIDTLRKLKADVAEIVSADSVITKEEKKVIEDFNEYIKEREKSSDCEEFIDYSDRSFMTSLAALTDTISNKGGCATALIGSEDYSWLNKL